MRRGGRKTMAEGRRAKLTRLKAHRKDLAYMLGLTPDWQIRTLAYLIRRLDALDAQIRMREMIQ